jgi:hypothetical protein
VVSVISEVSEVSGSPLSLSAAPPCLSIRNLVDMAAKHVRCDEVQKSLTSLTSLTHGSQFKERPPHLNGFKGGSA